MKPVITQDRFSELAEKMCVELAKDMHAEMMNAFDALCKDELEKMDTIEHPFFIVRSIGMVVGTDVVDKRFNVEAIQGMIRRVKAILKKRYY